MMESETIFVAIMALLIWSLLLGLIIGLATDAKQRSKNAKKQVKLLSHIASKLGVEEDKINEILTSK